MAGSGLGVTAVDDHLARLPGPQRETLEALRNALRRLLPEAEECIRYRMPCFAVQGKAVAGFDGFKEHCSYFPHSGSVIGAAGPLPPWASGDGGTLRFPIGSRLPAPLLRRLVRARLDEISAVTEGRRFVFFADGRVKAAGSMKGGALHGEWRWYRRDGSLMRVGRFRQGAQIGEWTSVTRDGRETTARRRAS